MTIKEMIDRTQVLIDKITLPCQNALLKMPVKFKRMKWSEYLVCTLIITLQYPTDTVFPSVYHVV